MFDIFAARDLRMAGPDDDDSMGPEWDRLANAVTQTLKDTHPFPERGNRLFIASDCEKDADLDGVSVGILSVTPLRRGLNVHWGWRAWFSDDEIADVGLSGVTWDADGEGAFGEDGDVFSLGWDLICDYLPENQDEDDWHFSALSAGALAQIADDVWSYFVRESHKVIEQIELSQARS